MRLASYRQVAVTCGCPVAECRFACCSRPPYCLRCCCHGVLIIQRMWASTATRIEERVKSSGREREWCLQEHEREARLLTWSKGLPTPCGQRMNKGEHIASESLRARREQRAAQTRPTLEVPKVPTASAPAPCKHVQRYSICIDNQSTHQPRL